MQYRVTAQLKGVRSFTADCSKRSLITLRGAEGAGEGGCQVAYENSWEWQIIYGLRNLLG